MRDFSIIWSAILILSAVFCIYLSSYSFHRRYISGAWELAAFLFFAAFFSFASLLEVNGFTPYRIRSFVKAGFFIASFTGPAFFLFSLKYFRERKLPLSLYILLFLVSFLIGALGWGFEGRTFLYSRYWLDTEPQGLVFRYEGGVLYYVQLAYIVSLSFAAEILLLIKVKLAGGQVRKQALYVFLGSLVPMVNILIFPERMGGGYDVQPLALGIMGCFIAVSLFRYQMFDILKAARENAVDNMGDGMIVLDRNGLVLYINRRGKELAPLKEFKEGTIFPSDSPFGSYLKRIVGTEREALPEKKSQFGQDGKYYRVFISPLREKKKDSNSGYVVIVHDMTEIITLLNDLEHRATYDSLTGIYNRRHWMELVRWELSEAALKGHRAGVIIFDIDHFKKINDMYGHIVGDGILKGLAERVGGNLRQSEIFGRFGGEEFCFFCTVGSGGSAYAIGERIRKTIEGRPFSSGGIQVGLTASFGVYHYSPGSEDNLETAIQKADEALYQAKKRGRNCTVLFTDHDDSGS